MNPILQLLRAATNGLWRGYESTAGSDIVTDPTTMAYLRRWRRQNGVPDDAQASPSPMDRLKYAFEDIKNMHVNFDPSGVPSSTVPLPRPRPPEAPQAEEVPAPFRSLFR